MAFDSPRLVSDSTSLIAGSNLFQISELKLIDDQWPHFLLVVDLRIILFLDLVLIITLKIAIK